MLTLISKLQYKNYESGEFINEKPRSLEETITLIRNYPWDTERQLTEVEPTCPSVTIINDNSEYLKLGPYFNQKFCFYYLDNAKHLYDLPVATLNEAIIIVTSFFEGTFNPKTFNKHTFNFSAAKHFATQSFWYTFNNAEYNWNFAGGLIFTIIGLIVLASVFMPYSYASLPFGIIISALGLWRLNICRKHYQLYKHMRLYITRGQNVFYYGLAGTENAYEKSKIKEISGPVTTQSRNQNRVSTYTLSFMDGSCLKLSSLLIRPVLLHQKFVDDSIFN